MEPRICIFFRDPPPADRWHKGDHVWRKHVRRLVRGPDPIGGIKRVCVNLLRGLDRIGQPYKFNLAFSDITHGDRVGMIGRGLGCLDGYDKPNRVLAGIAVVEHPAEWPTLFNDHPVSQYIVHCEWVKAMYASHYGDRVSTWAVGIDTDEWQPQSGEKQFDVLVYDKIRWDTDRVRRALLEPLILTLEKKALRYAVVRYGEYTEEQYRRLLGRSKSMLFVCEHETQGLAYQEALSCGVPVLAWDPGQWLDGFRYRFGETYVSSTSVPFFDARCGVTFTGVPDFENALGTFIDGIRSNLFKPREYILENLTLEKGARNYLKLLETFCS